MEKLKIISADDHLSETPDLWQKRLPKHLRESGPRFIDLEGGGQGWMLPGAQVPRPLGLDVMAGRKFEDYKVSGVRWDEVRPGCYDPHARLKDMDEGGVYATVLYPNAGLGFGGGRGFSQDWEMAIACVRAYNDHLSDFCSVDTKRLAGAGQIPMQSPESAVAEVERLGKMPGIRAALLPLYPADDKEWNHPSYEPLWSAIEANGLSVSIHIGEKRGQKIAPWGMSQPGGIETMINTVTLGTAEAFAYMLWSGVFDRHPKLTVVSVESGIGWLAYFRERANNVYRRHRHWTKAGLQNEPGTYFGKNIFATFEEDMAGILTRDLIGVETLLWSSDYPHTDTSWPKCRENIEEHFENVPDADKRKVVSENAARVYGFST
ncbi:MAG: amidohydrolase family protein [Candidatus Binatia bacterium]